MVIENSCRSISIIICSNKVDSVLMPTIRSIFATSVPSDTTVELIVARNGMHKTDGTICDENAKMAVREIWISEPGKANALNQAVAISTGSILVFTDDDAEVPHDWLSTLLEPIWSGRADAVAGGSRLAVEIVKDWMTPVHRALLAEVDPIQGGSWVLTGLNMAFHRRILSKVSGFNVRLGPGRLGFAEDTLFTIEVKQAGFRIEGVRESVVLHRPDTSRLDRAAWKKRAKAEGACHAHIYYHHGNYSLRRAPIDWVYWQVRQFIAEIKTHLTRQGNCPASDELLHLWERAGFFRQLVCFIGCSRQPRSRSA